MVTFLLIWTTWNFGSAAVNTAFYVDSGSPLSLGSAIFCGLMGVVSTAWFIREVGQ